MSEEFTRSESSEIKIMSGNELIIQGALEAGFHLYTGYPGSPLADFFNILYSRKKELQKRGIKVAIANSEANAAAMASGCKQAGRDCLVGMKSMGLHVASDALSVGNFANPGKIEIDSKTGQNIYPGVVIVVGDDPWSLSTSTPADSRYLFKHLHIPFLEPSTPQELKDWTCIALEISKRTSVYQGMLLTTFMAEGGGRVEIGPPKLINSDPIDINTSDFDLSKNVMVPPNSLKADISMIEERFPKVSEVLADMKLDKIIGNQRSDIGFISSGVIFETLKQVMEEAQLLEIFDLYKLACSFPLVDELLVPWLKNKKTVIVVEEKRGFLETQLSELCLKHGLSIELIGKTCNGETCFPSHGGLNYELVRDGIKKSFNYLGLNGCQNLVHENLVFTDLLPKRLPTFCPGCPHRETLSLLKDLRGDLKAEGIDLVTHGDVGCYSLSFLPPFKEMHNLSAMGQGGALGAGLDMFTKNPSVTLMGDSTFFHSGMTDVSNSVQCDHDITYIILDNDNTAMTGHQMTPASGENVEGRKRPKQDILNLVKSLGVHIAIEVNPSDRYFYKNIMKEHIKLPGVKVIVSNKECALTFHGRKKGQERKELAKEGLIKEKRIYQINTDSCEDCRVCVESTGCPGLTQIEDAYGTKVSIDSQICVSDSYCTKLKACPSFEAVDILDYHPSKYKKSNEVLYDFENLSEPDRSISFEDISKGKDFRVIVTGVGGSGVTTISRVLAEASVQMNGRDDLDFKFVDQKGLAQRNGNVTGHMAIFRKGKSYGATTPLGTGDLLLSPDLLDGSGQVHFLGSDGIGLFDEDFQMPLSIMLDNEVDSKALNKESLIQKLNEQLGEKIIHFPLKNLSEKEFGKTVYSSAMLLGVAYQLGRLPFSLENMNSAFLSTMKKGEFENNWKAFSIGRFIIKNGIEKTVLLYGEQQKDDFSDLYEQSIKESLPPWINEKFVLNKFRSSLKSLVNLLPDLHTDHLSQYIHDIFIYDRGANIERYLQDIGELIILYKDKSLLEISLRTLTKTYFIKDEVFISHAMISPLKISRDKKQYSKIGKKYSIKRINRPSFDVFGKTLEFDISPSNWMLKLMRHLRLLRLVLPGWHQKEKNIAKNIRKQLLEIIPKLSSTDQRMKLKEVENIKGYRNVRYTKAKESI